MNDEKYFVGSNGDAPEHLYFDKQKAFEGGHKYVDAFDADGKAVTAYESKNDVYVEM